MGPEESAREPVKYHIGRGAETGVRWCHCPSVITPRRWFDLPGLAWEQWVTGYFEAAPR